MGTYLAMGLKLVFQAYKPDVVKYAEKDSTVEDVLKQLEMKYDLGDVYTRYEKDDCFEYRLDDNVLQQELCPFLNDFYDLRYDNERKDYKDEVIAAINELPDQTLSSIIPLLKEKKFELFQTDDYSKYMYMGDWGLMSDKIWTHTECAILSLDGKFIMECYGSLFYFLRKSIVAQLPDYKLNQAVDVWLAE